MIKIRGQQFLKKRGLHVASIAIYLVLSISRVKF